QPSQGDRGVPGHRRGRGAGAGRSPRAGRRAAVPRRGACLMLEVKGVSAGYGSFQALFDVDLEVKAGEAVAVLGPNGAGKTTLLRAISRLIEIRQGELWMEGRRYDRLPAWDVIGLGIAQVPEGRRLFPRLSVEDNLRIGAYL